MKTSWLQIVSRWFTAFKTAVKRLYFENYGYHASALSFITILSLVPLFTIIIYFFTFFPHFEKLIELAKTYAYQNFLPPSNDVVQSYLYLFVNQATKLPLISIFFLVVTSILLIITIENTLDQIWRIKTKSKNIPTLIFIFCLIVIFPLFVGFVTIAIEYFYNILWLKPFQVELILLGNLIINSLIFTLFYVLGPNHKVTWRNSITIGILTAIAFELIKRSFVIYINNFSNYEIIYGTLAVIPILLLWIYICWYLVLYGAILLETKDKLDYDNT